jgi:hypothetical protein
MRKLGTFGLVAGLGFMALVGCANKQTGSMGTTSGKCDASCAKACCTKSGSMGTVGAKSDCSKACTKDAGNMGAVSGSTCSGAKSTCTNK